MSDTLTARLLAEIERREGIAREAMSATGGSWEHAGNGVFWIEGDEQRIILGEAHGYVTPHIAENDPHAVLAYLAALRGVVELHRSDGCDRCESCGEEGWGANFPCPTISAVAEALGVAL